jgi:hypothetical protein
MTDLKTVEWNELSETLQKISMDQLLFLQRATLNVLACREIKGDRTLWNGRHHKNNLTKEIKQCET